MNEPEELQRILAKLDELRGPLSMADAIVLAGTAAVEKAARDAGFNVKVRLLAAAATRRRNGPTSRASIGSSPRPTGSAIT